MGPGVSALEGTGSPAEILVIPRPRLLGLLDRATPLTLLIAPTGSGKRTLLRDWVAQSKCALVDLKKGHCQPLIFAQELRQALNYQYPEFLNLGKPPIGDLFPVLREALRSSQRPLGLVIDNLHHLGRAGPVLSWIQELIDQGSANFRLVLSSRENIPLNFGKLLCSGRARRLTANELWFSTDEIAQMWERKHGQTMGYAQLHECAAKTEGWPAAVSLHFRGLDDCLPTYIDEEILAEVPGEARFLMAATCPGDTFQLGLAQQVCPQFEVEGLLLELERRRLVNRLAGREEFRYPVIVREFLRQDLALKSHYLTACGQVAHWLVEQEGDLAAAYRLLQRQRLWNHLAEFIARHGQALADAVPIQELLSGLQTMPSSVTETDPTILLFHSQLWLTTGNGPLALQQCKAALLAAQQTQDEAALAKVIERLCHCCIQFGDNSNVREICQLGLEKCPPQQTGTLALLHCWLGITLVGGGDDFSTGYREIATGYSLSQRAQDRRAMAYAAKAYGLGFHFLQGSFQEARQVLEEGLIVCEGGDDLYDQICVCLALVSVVEADYEAVSRHLRRINDGRAGSAFVECGKRLVAATRALELGSTEESECLLLAMSESAIPAQLKSWYYRTRLLLEVSLGRYGQISILAGQVEQSLELNGAGLYGPECLLAVAYAHWRAGQASLAAQCLGRTQALSARAGARFWTMKGQLLGSAMGLNEPSAEGSDYKSYWLADPWSLVAARPSKPAALRISTLGGLKLRRGESEFRPKLAPLTLRLLKYLLTLSGRGVSGERLQEDLWPRLPAGKARKNLGVQLTLLRKGLELGEVVIRAGDLYCLNPELVEVDIDRFELLANRLKLDSLRAAEALYQGDFLAEDSYDDWILHRRQKLQSIHQRVLEQLGDLLVDQGELDQAALRFRRLIQSEWPSQSAFLKLCECHQALADCGSMWRDYTEFRSRLQGLGENPTPQVIERVNRVLQKSNI